MKKDIYAEINGDLYLKAKYSGIHTLILMMDGMQITFVGKTGYLKVDDTIKWYENEMEVATIKPSSKALEALRKAKAAWLSQKGQQ